VEKKSVYAAIFLCAVAVAGLLAPPAGARPFGSAGDSNYNLLILTPGHSQTIMFELDDVIFNDSETFHACYFLWLGEGRITVRVGPASDLGEFSGAVYATVGIIGLQPVIEYAYNAETISVSMDVPAAGVGMLFSSIITGIGDPDFPVIMSMIVSHQ